MLFQNDHFVLFLDLLKYFIFWSRNVTKILRKNNVTEILKRARKIQSLGKVRNFQNFLYDHYNAQKPIFKKKVKIALLVNCQKYLHKGFIQFSEMWLNLCSFKWLSLNLNMVRSHITEGFWTLYTGFGKGWVFLSRSFLKR